MPRVYGAHSELFRARQLLACVSQYLSLYWRRSKLGESSSGREPTFLLAAKVTWRCGSWALEAAGQGFRVSMNLDKIREAAERVARSVGVEVVDVEWQVGKQRLLRLYIDRPPSLGQNIGSGISHSDCEAVSEQLNVILDVEDLVPGPAYVLEVSSPGLDRKLLKPSDYERFAGRLAKVWLNQPVENAKFLEGRLAGIADGVVQISVRDRTISFPLANVRKANLVVEF